MYETRLKRKKDLTIACFSRPSSLDDLAGNLALMKEAIIEVSQRGCDLLVFGEAYLQGFEGFSFSYREDIHKALFVRSPDITLIRHWAREHKVGVAFGFLENEAGALYSSYLVIDKAGELAGHYRR
ncbi:MAG TPA: carbon-nitrogen hydrolase family protein, partial [Clostridia bacterium]|nr:carbon-nitrogen hydrolase family protein [Clostridia bacterium]